MDRVRETHTGFIPADTFQPGFLEPFRRLIIIRKTNTIIRGTVYQERLTVRTIYIFKYQLLIQVIIRARIDKMPGVIIKVHQLLLRMPCGTDGAAQPAGDVIPCFLTGSSKIILKAVLVRNIHRVVIIPLHQVVVARNRPHRRVTRTKIAATSTLRQFVNEFIRTHVSPVIHFLLIKLHLFVRLPGNLLICHVKPAFPVFIVRHTIDMAAY